MEVKSKEQLAAIKLNYYKRSKQLNKTNSSKKKNTVDNDLPTMRLAKIKNRYMFDSDNPQGVHTYVTYTDKKSKEVRAIPTTHLYVPDKANMEKLRKGLLCKVKFPNYDAVSGVHNYYYAKDSKGRDIDLKNNDVVLSKNKLADSLVKKIKSFVRFEGKN